MAMGGNRSPGRAPAFDAELMQRAIAKLEVNEREVIILTEFCGYSPLDAAEALGVSEETVLARICSGLLRLSDDSSDRASSQQRRTGT